MTNRRKIAVLGSKSFSGASFVADALNRGAEVIGISRSPEPADVFLPYRWSGEPQAFRFYQFDLNHQLDAIDDLLKTERPSCVVNFAAQSMVGESWSAPDHWFQTNVVATVRLHDRMRRYDFLDRYVHVTTPEVYGSVSGFIHEDTPFNPSTPYAVSRAAADMSLRTFFAAYQFPVVFTRAANVYGPGQALYRIIPRTILSIRLGRKMELHGGGVSRRNFIHIRDVADATWRIMSHGVPGETYHISGTDLVSIRSLVEQICTKMSADLSEVVAASDDRLGKDTLYALDSTKLRDSLGWRPEISLDTGLDECIAWVDRSLSALRTMPFDYVHKP